MCAKNVDIRKAELRAKQIKKKELWLADSASHLVVARIVFGTSTLLTEELYKKTRHLHHCANNKLPYKHTWSTTILKVHPLRRGVPYKKRRVP